MSHTDTVTLRFPRNPQFYPVARMVVGGMAAPLQMSIDALDDLQLAISHLLDFDDLPAGEDVTLRLDVTDGRMDACLGTFEADSVEAAFDRSEQRSGEFGLRKLLETIVDEVLIETRDGGDWVTLTKRVKAAV